MKPPCTMEGHVLKNYTPRVKFFKIVTRASPRGFKIQKKQKFKKLLLMVKASTVAMVMGASPWPLRASTATHQQHEGMYCLRLFCLVCFPLFMFCLLFSFVCCRCCCCCCCCCLLLCVQHRTTAISISCDIINDLTTTCRYVLLCLFLLRFIFFTFFLLLLLLLLLLCA